jgi:polyhydroxyalkanoate synthase
MLHTQTAALDAQAPLAGKDAAVRGLTPADLDRAIHDWQSRFTGGKSPSTVGLAWLDWAAHAANAPFGSAALGVSALRQWSRLGQAAYGVAPSISPEAGDHRFAAPAWRQLGYAMMVQAVLLGEQWWGAVVQSPAGVAPANRRILDGGVKQLLALISPSNLAWLNPEVAAKTRAEGGANLIQGFANLMRDQAQAQVRSSGAGAPERGTADGAFAVGKDVAVTPGKVVFRNALMELIQYAPTTPTVAPEPVLIIPAWIMKFYILDLSPHNSLVRWLVGQGRTVFMVSWRNPGADMRDVSLDDYRVEGVMAAVSAVQAICGEAKIHATGYCLGGTLLTIAAAAMARDRDDRLASLSLFAAQCDFTEAGGLKVFITEDQLSFLDDVMQARGYLSSAQMGAAFQMLRPNDLIWSPAVHEYLLGEEDAPFDLMAWNADGTRLPARMHIEYLRRLFLNNDLAEGRFEVEGRPLALGDLKSPLFVVGAEEDQVAPWRSVFKLALFNNGDMTFVLTSGGHNAGVVSEPGHPHRHFRLRRREAGGRTLGPDEWLDSAAPQDGSWWPKWNEWLVARSGRPIRPPPMGRKGYEPLCDAPGQYVLER